jgi:hypothetical protein
MSRRPFTAPSVAARPRPPAEATTASTGSAFPDLLGAERLLQQPHRLLLTALPGGLLIDHVVERLVPRGKALQTRPVKLRVVGRLLSRRPVGPRSISRAARPTARATRIGRGSSRRPRGGQPTARPAVTPISRTRGARPGRSRTVPGTSPLPAAASRLGRGPSRSHRPRRPTNTRPCRSLTRALPSHALPSHALPSHALTRHALTRRGLGRHVLACHALAGSTACTLTGRVSHSRPGRARCTIAGDGRAEVGTASRRADGSATRPAIVWRRSGLVYAVAALGSGRSRAGGGAGLG